MFPRKPAVSRFLGGMILVIFCVWLWLSMSTSAVTNDVILSGDYFRSTASRTRQETRINNSLPSRGPTQSHHHNNETLETLRKNMTILKANMSGLDAIVNKIRANKNETQVVLDTKVKFKVNDSPMKDKTASALKAEENQPVLNPHPFNYIFNAPSICKDKNIFLIAYVHTAPAHYKRRMVIRQTWGNPKYYPETLVRVVFVMGKTQDKPEVQNALAFESEEYGDIVQEDFEDTYKNLTYKGVAALKWISNYCNNSKFVLKTDDDIFVNMFTLLRHLSSIDRFGMNNTNLLMCLVWHRMKVMREGKWKVDESEFKDSHYPTYCSGSAYTMSTDVAIAMHKISYQVPFFWVDDFYITGLLPMKLGTITHKQFMSTYVLDGRKLQEKFTGPQWFTYIFSHVHDLNKIQSVWETLVKLANGQKSAKVKYALPGQLPAAPAEVVKQS